MELHLIGEEVPAAELTAQALADGDTNIVGYPADESVGAEGGRRRQMRNPESFPAEAQAAASERYASMGLSTLTMSTQIGMTVQQRARYNSVTTQSAAWFTRGAGHGGTQQARTAP